MSDAPYPAGPRPTPRVDISTLRVVVVALGAISVGFLLGATSWQTGDADTAAEVQTTLRGALPLSESDTSPDASVEATGSTVPTTVGVTTTRPSLVSLAPVMGGRTLVGTGINGAFRWTAGAASPTIVAKGQEAEGEWDATGRFLAVIKSWDNDGWGELWVLAGGSLRPVHLDVRGYRWHPSEPHLAFLGRQTVDGPTQLYVAHITPASGVKVVRALEIHEISNDTWPWIVGWGDWGFLVTEDFCEQDGCTQSATTIDPNGQTLGRLDGPAGVVTVSPNGVILLTDQTGPHDQARNLRWTGPEFAAETAAELPAHTDVWNIQWAPDGSAYTMNFFDDVAGVDKTMLVQGKTRTELSGIEWVTGFSPDGQLVLGVPDGGSMRRVLVIDTTTDERYEITLPWDAWYVRIGSR